jgi:chloramphenicol 3-O-phosphotransferase
VTADRPQAIVLITGIQAAGKSTVAQALAERLPRSVHVRGDLFRRMVINGRADITPDLSDEAIRQLRLRYKLMAATCEEYFSAGFTVVAQDIILGELLTETIAMIGERPLLVVVLAPRPEVVAAREAGRGKTAYDEWTVAMLDAGLRNQTPHVGLWLDTSEQTAEETVDEILRRAWTEGTIT